MPKKPIEVRALAAALNCTPRSTTLDPDPATRPSNPKAALRRCCSAWQRAFDAKMEECKSEREAKFHATQAAREAYRNAMPMLAGFDGIRDFVACVAHGILIGAFSQDDARQLLYAAQVANGTLNHAPKPIPSPVRTTPTPTPSPLPPKMATFDELFPIVTNTESTT